MLFTITLVLAATLALAALELWLFWRLGERDDRRRTHERRRAAVLDSLDRARDTCPRQRGSAPVTPAASP